MSTKKHNYIKIPFEKRPLKDWGNEVNKQLIDNGLEKQKNNKTILKPAYSQVFTLPATSHSIQSGHWIYADSLSSWLEEQIVTRGDKVGIETNKLSASLINICKDTTTVFVRSPSPADLRFLADAQPPFKTVFSFDISEVIFFDFFNKNENTLKKINPAKWGIELRLPKDQKKLNSIPKTTALFASAIDCIEAILRHQKSGKEIPLNITLRVDIQQDYLLAISELRALQNTWSIITSCYDNTSIPKLVIHAVAHVDQSLQNEDFKTIEIITKSMAAIQGGCGVLSIADDSLSAGFKRNISDIIRHETSINAVSDPFKGAYAIEELTHIISQEIIEGIQEIEKHQGWSNYINQ